MTKTEFNSLSVREQNTFINNGGVLESSSVAIDTPEVSPVDGSPEVSSHTVVSSSVQQDFSSFFSSDKHDGLMIWADPVEMLFAIDRDIESNETSLHPWQIQYMLDFANGSWSQDNPFQTVMRACNGSGKDMYVIAACAVWISMRYKTTTCPVTSSSGFQLDNQTCKHTKRMCESVNRFFQNEKLWDCKYRNYTFRFHPTDNEFNSQILCYATDEPGKAEGFHPAGKGKRMAIFCSEDKTIPDDINDAINKCSGYTHRVHASTPGKSFGHFYDYCMMAVSRKALKKITDVSATDWIEYHITSDMCPHLGKDYKAKVAKNIPGGETSSAYKSQVDAEFGGDDGEMIAIPFTYIWQCQRNVFNVTHIVEDHNTGGFDIGDGGAESSISVRNGNKHLITEGFKFEDSEDTIRYLIEFFKKYELNHPKSLIRGDCIGIGSIVLSQLKNRGWKNVRYLDSRAKARRPSVFKNRNAEIWFNTRSLFVRHEICGDIDQKLAKQLGSRHYKLIDGKIHQMWSKLEERSHGFPSPDRADSFNYCFWDYESSCDEVPEDNEIPFESLEKKNEVVGDFTLRGWAEGKSVKHNINDHLDDLDEIKAELIEANKRRLLIKGT